MPSRADALQRDHDNHMKFNKDKCCTLAWSSPACMDRLGNEMLESSTVEQELGVVN